MTERLSLIPGTRCHPPASNRRPLTAVHQALEPVPRFQDPTQRWLTPGTQACRLYDRPSYFTAEVPLKPRPQQQECFSPSPPPHRRAGPPFITQEDGAASVTFAKIERKEMEETPRRLKPQCRRDPCPFHLLSSARANHAPKPDIYRTGERRRSAEKESDPRHHPPHLPTRRHLRKAPKERPKKKKNQCLL